MTEERATTPPDPVKPTDDRPLVEGDLVWYRQTCYGGYGFRRDVPAIFLWETKRRIHLELKTPEGPNQRTVRIAVAKHNVRRRDD